MPGARPSAARVGPPMPAGRRGEAGGGAVRRGVITPQPRRGAARMHRVAVGGDAQEATHGGAGPHHPSGERRFAPRTRQCPTYAPPAAPHKSVRAAPSAWAVRRAAHASFARAARLDPGSAQMPTVGAPRRSTPSAALRGRLPPPTGPWRRPPAVGGARAGAPDAERGGGRRPKRP